MRASYHFWLTLLLCLPFLYVGDKRGAILCLVAGTLIDVDHEVDHFIQNGIFTLSASELSKGTDRYFCPLHSWELLIIVFILSRKYSSLFGAGIGMGVHLIIDMFTNNMPPLSLFLLYRYLNRFQRVYHIWT